MKEFRPLVRFLLGSIGITLLLLSTSAQARPPNIVFILADDLGWRDLGCYGSSFYDTPRIDHLAAQGMRFTSAYAAANVCSPTRASIMTGKSPALLGLTDWLPGRPDKPEQKMRGPVLPDHLSLEEVTVAEVLRAAGYATALVGKWHLGGKGSLPQDHGFEVNIGGSERGSPPSYFSPYGLPGLKDGPKGEYLTDRLTDEALQFILQRKDRPFFLYLAHYAVHNPQQAKAPIVAKYRAKLAAHPSTGEEFAGEGSSRNRQVQNQPVYAAMLASLDESVGRLLDQLRALGLEENTIVLFNSDNGGVSTSEGWPTSNLPLRAGKGWNYEGGIRVPLIVRWQGAVMAGSLCHEPVISTDYYPTLIEMAGVKAPTRQRLEGTSLTPLLRGNAVSGAPHFWHYPHYSNQGGRPGGAVRAGDFKLVQDFESMRVQLFRLPDDIGETHDLASSLPEKTAELTAMLQHWREQVGARMPVAK